MGIDERRRHDMYLKLEDVLGTDPADTLMSHLPPVGWAEVATKEYVDLRLQATENRLESLFERGISQLQRQMNTQTRTFIISIVTLFVTIVLGMAGLVAAIGQALA